MIGTSGEIIFSNGSKQLSQSYADWLSCFELLLFYELMKILF